MQCQGIILAVPVITKRSIKLIYYRAKFNKFTRNNFCTDHRHLSDTELTSNEARNEICLVLYLLPIMSFVNQYFLSKSKIVRQVKESARENNCDVFNLGTCKGIKKSSLCSSLKKVYMQLTYDS